MNPEPVPARFALLEARLIAANRAVDALFGQIAVAIGTSVLCALILPALAAALTRAPA